MWAWLNFEIKLSEKSAVGLWMKTKDEIRNEKHVFFCNVQWGDDFKTRNLVTCFFFKFTSRMNRSTEKKLKSPPSLLLYRFIHGMFPLQTGWCSSSRTWGFMKYPKYVVMKWKLPEGLAGLDCCYQGPALVPLGVAERLTSWLTWYRCGRWKWM